MTMIWAHLGMVGTRLIQLDLHTFVWAFQRLRSSSTFYGVFTVPMDPRLDHRTNELIPTHVNQVGSLERHHHELDLGQCELLRFHFHESRACLTLLTIPLVGHSTAAPLCPMASSASPSHFDGHHLQWAREDCDPRKEPPEHQLQGRAHHVQLSPLEGSRCFQLAGYWFGQGDLRPPEFVQSKITERIHTHWHTHYI